jgi:hypothetical protein
VTHNISRENSFRKDTNVSSCSAPVFAKENAETKKLNDALKGTKGKKKETIDVTKEGDG